MRSSAVPEGFCDRSRYVRLVTRDQCFDQGIPAIVFQRQGINARFQPYCRRRRNPFCSRYMAFRHSQFRKMMVRPAEKAAEKYGGCDQYIFQKAVQPVFPGNPHHGHAESGAQRQDRYCIRACRMKKSVAANENSGNGTGAEWQCVQHGFFPLYHFCPNQINNINPFKNLR